MTLESNPMGYMESNMEGFLKINNRIYLNKTSCHLVAFLLYSSISLILEVSSDFEKEWECSLTILYLV